MPPIQSDHDGDHGNGVHRPTARFAEDLARLYPSTVRVPAALDHEIAQAAWEHFEGVRRRRRIRRWGLVGLIAAAVIVVIWGSQEFSRLRRASEHQSAPPLLPNAP